MVMRIALSKRRSIACASTVGLGVAFALSAFTTTQAQEEPVVKPEQHGETLDEATEKAEAEASAESVEEAPASVMVSFFTDLNAENLKEKIETYYDPTATLEDPFGRFERQAEITDHLTTLFAGAKSIAFEVRSEFQSGDESMTLWTVSVVHSKLRGDEPVVVEGVTHARLVNGKIAEQRDYYDVGNLVYEHVSVIGSLVRWVKGKVGG